MKMFIKLCLLLPLLAINACSSSSGNNEQEEDPTFEISSISLISYKSAEITIDNTARSVSIILPNGSELGETQLLLTIPSTLTSTPASGDTIDLADFNAIYLSAPSGKAVKYTVTVKIKGSSQTTFYWVRDKKYYVEGIPSDHNIILKYPYGADLSNLSFDIQTDVALTFEPDITTGIDLSSPKTVKVIAEDGETTDTYEFSASCYPKDTGVRGVYLPSPAHTSSFLTYENVRSSISLLKELNFNCLFVCVWASSKVAWNSETLLANSTYTDETSGNMYSSYSGGSGDALKDIIATAHENGIKVILWFEYGFMHVVGGVNQSDPILAKHPDWIGIGNDGSYANYNNSDFYLNAYNPEVQQFILDLMKEAVTLYPEVDGVQGDDRLPAMPVNSGYDDYTKNKYKDEMGDYPPSDYSDESWLNWRIDILNNFADTIHSTIKSIDSDLLVCFAPNKYPWCKEKLMQDWPQWIKNGDVDLLTVQCYVVTSYENDVLSSLNLVKENTDKNILNPAMILKNGDAILSIENIASQLLYNRSVGTSCESQFWFDGLKDTSVQEIFKAYYSYPVEFPDL